MNNRIACVLLAINLTGCVSFDQVIGSGGEITEDISKVDGTRTVRMTPVIAGQGGSLADFGLFWDSNKGDSALLELEIDGAESIAREEPMEVKIDGALMKLPPADPTSFGEAETIRSATGTPSNVTRKRYWITRDQILTMANGKEGFYRLHFMNHSYADGEINYRYQDYSIFIPFSFRRFHLYVWG